VTAFFLTPGSPEWEARQREIAERDRRHDDEMAARVARVEARLSDDTRDGMRLIELARLLGPEHFARRAEGLSGVERRRQHPRANEESYQRATIALERTARLAIEWPLRQAAQVLALVQTWED